MLVSMPIPHLAPALLLVALTAALSAANGMLGWSQACGW
jgi:hypothetical protein